ncbi:hypothetical protein HYH02_013464 [Chlamydomonas schloesseri]|uniref:U-box domain-containing protein n=1 Tax=Chlamydomonas schloesseri TaxID=2026947 RepID=A0A835SPP6_9CHLO|nr:hypothetical protein HYH02_013464 [Chlamydomonas schloesseri]|eukprot:KAG2431032.1 hypothetical protein HYH02_013464 [Chlamydomonas schloesseri]
MSSIESFLNRSVLFVQGIDRDCPKAEILAVLNQVCKAPQQGRIEILQTPDGKNRGTAFCNFWNKEDAASALDEWRFKLELRGRPLRIQYSSDREHKELLQGPAMARFKVLVRNVPEDMDAEALYYQFVEFGEILQLVDTYDPYGQHFAIIQYIDVKAVADAIKHANRTRVDNHVLVVEQFKTNYQPGPLPRNINSMGAAGGPATAAPGAAAVGDGGGGANGPSTSAAGRMATQPGMTYAALQQQQEAEAAAAAAKQKAAARQQRRSASGEAGGDAGGGGAASAGPAPAHLPIPSFYAAAPAAPATSATSPGSLLSLLNTALHHARTLEEMLCCPITQEPLADPVLAADGNTYERSAIESWLRDHDTSPMTNGVLPHKNLTPNNLIRKIAEELQGISHGDDQASAAPAASGGDTAAAAADASAAGTSGYEDAGAEDNGGYGGYSGYEDAAPAQLQQQQQAAAGTSSYTGLTPEQEAAASQAVAAAAASAVAAALQSQHHQQHQQQQVLYQQQQHQPRAVAAAPAAAAQYYVLPGGATASTQYYTASAAPPQQMYAVQQQMSGLGMGGGTMGGQYGTIPHTMGGTTYYTYQ